MTDPSTHQDSPKTPEHPWPPVVLSRRSPDEREVNFCVFPADLPPIEEESETYIPVSALLSDEVGAAVAKTYRDLMEGATARGDDEIVQAVLQAAIDQVGGAEHGE